MTEPDLSETLRRRHLLGRGAALAGTAAGAVALGVVGTRPAAAANGDQLTQGKSFTGTATTTLRVDSATVAPLTLTNTKGPALQLTSVGEDFAGTLEPGQLLAIDERPVVGARDELGSYAVGLATLDDVDSLALPYAIDPDRLVDTRSASGRTNILNPDSLDGSGKLEPGKYIDVVVDDATRDYTVDAVFLNLTSTGSTANGYLSVYPPGTRPNSSTLSYTKGVTIANFSLAATRVVGSSFVVRVYSSALTHVIIDQTGALVSFLPGPAATARAKARTRAAARRSVARRPKSWAASRRR